MNLSDSERVASVLERLGYEKGDKLEEADLLVFNTCSVRQKAEDRVTGLRPHLESYRENNPGMKFAITGCMVRITSSRESKKKDQLLFRMPEVDMAFRIEDVAKLPELLKEVDPEVKFEDELDEGTLENYFKIAPKKNNNSSVFVPIMTGCDKFCTYCIVPFTRGREYSRDFDEIIKECTRHVEEGALEITLVGQTVNTYGLSFNDRKSGKFENYEMNPFATLLREVDKLKDKGLKRLRFTSPHPRDFHDDVIAAMAECETVSPYFHMPVQSGDNRTLRRMNRNYTMEEYAKILGKIRKAIPDVSISTDIIVGFCGETDEEFERTFQMYKELEWDWCFIARYSPRKGTYSEKKLEDDVTPAQKAERWHRLNDLMLSIAEKKAAALLGETVEVMVNTQIGETCSGRTDGFKEVKFKSGRQLVGHIVPVKITEVRSIEIFGELV